MKVGIVGGGSIGLLVSGYLYKEHEVTIYCRRKEQKQKINDDGLFTAESSKPRPVKALLLDELQQEDCLIICVKQSQISTILTRSEGTRLNSSHVSISYAVFCLTQNTFT